MSSPTWDDIKAPSWDDLHRRAPPPSAHDPDFDTLTAGLFGSGPGRVWLLEMRRRTIELYVNAGIVGLEQLRAIEAQRQFVRDVEASRDRGLQPKKPT